MYTSLRMCSSLVKTCLLEIIGNSEMIMDTGYGYGCGAAYNDVEDD